MEQGANYEGQPIHEPTGWWSRYVFSQDHKIIALQYITVALAIGLTGMFLSLMMRMQLGFPGLFESIDAGSYYQDVTMHVMIMVIYLLTALFLGGFGNYLIPLMLGSRDMAFPFVNMLSFWVYFLSVIILVSSFFVESGPTGAGWTLYPPQSILEGTPGGDGAGIILMLVSLAVFIIAFTMGGLNYITTVLQSRAKGMTLMRMPLIIWCIFLATFLGLLAFPALLVGAIMLIFDRVLETSFFMPEIFKGGEVLDYGGGSPVLFQHLFWFFGHPEVYILILPAMGIISEIIPTFSRKPIFGYNVVVLSGVIIGFLGWMVWSHHMFTVGLGPIANSIFAITTMLIAIPTGVKIFNWIATLWKGSIDLKSPMLYSIGFIVLFVIGGLSGTMHSSAASDAQQQDTYFIVAHIHYVLFGGSLFAIFAGIHYWFPKVTGRLMNELSGRISFLLLFVGMNITFFPMHFLGLDGMPRRTYTYSSEMGWDLWNLVATLGVFFIIAAVLLFLHNVTRSWRKGEKAEIGRAHV